MRDHTKEKQIRLGLVGLGAIAGHQLAALRLCSDKYTLVAACDRDLATSAKVPGIPFHENIETLLAETELDAVLVSVPNREHFRVCKLALAAGKSVVVEKPPTETVAQLKALLVLADERQVQVYSAFHAAFARELQWFLAERRRIEEAHGPITFMRCFLFDPYLTEGAPETAAQSLTGSWIDSGINGLSIIARLAPGFIIEDYRISSFPGTPWRDVQASVDFRYPLAGHPQQGMGSIETNWTLGKERKLTQLFFGLNGNRIDLDGAGQRVVEVDPHGKETVLADFSHAMPRLQAHYVRLFSDCHSHLVRGDDNRVLALDLMEKLLTPYPP